MDSDVLCVGQAKATADPEVEKRQDALNKIEIRGGHHSAIKYKVSITLPNSFWAILQLYTGPIIKRYKQTTNEKITKLQLAITLRVIKKN